MSKRINPADLIPMDVFTNSEPIAIDLVYAKANHPRNIFKEAIYKPSAKLWVHKDLAAIILLTAQTLDHKYNWKLELYDCLRTVDSQEQMQKTQIVKNNPQWMEEPRLLSPPGAGAHPRAMAIDVGPVDESGHKIDMGTHFDDMSEQSHRDCRNLPDIILDNRRKLEEAFVSSAQALNFPFLPLPNEWWDFRFPNHYSAQFEPLSDVDLPPQMQMTNTIDNNISNFDEAHFLRLAESILALIKPHNGNI